MALMPIVGFLLTKVQPRLLVAFGLITTGWSILHMTNFSLGIDFQTVMMARVYQSVGLAFLFVPISTVAYATITPGKNNAASALVNLARNIGGSFGIAFVTTLLARRQQYHHSVLVQSLTPGDPEYSAALQRMTQMFMHYGAGAVDAMRQAQAMIMGQLERQATMLAFIDSFHLLGWVFLALLPFVFLLRRVKLGKGAAAGAH
jgi:DHA2 family multidrug resistance protein